MGQDPAIPAVVRNKWGAVERVSTGLLATRIGLQPARLQDSVDLDAVRDDLAGVVQAALEPAHLSVWTAPRD